MSLTVDELRVAAEAAARWPQGTPNGEWPISGSRRCSGPRSPGGRRDGQAILGLRGGDVV